MCGGVQGLPVLIFLGEITASLYSDGNHPTGRETSIISEEENCQCSAVRAMGFRAQDVGGFEEDHKWVIHSDGWKHMEQILVTK